MFFVKAAAAGCSQVALVCFRITLDSLIVAFIGTILMFSSSPVNGVYVVSLGVIGESLSISAVF